MIKSTGLKNGFQVFHWNLDNQIPEQCSQVCEKAKSSKLHTREELSGMRESQNPQSCTPEKNPQVCEKAKTFKVAHQRRTLRYARKPKPSKLHTREELSGMRESQNLKVTYQRRALRYARKPKPQSCIPEKSSQVCEKAKIFKLHTREELLNK